MFGNGNGRNTIPIVGQPFEIKGWHFSALLVCKCGATPTPLLISNAGLTQCKACLRAYAIQGVQMVPGQSPSFNVTVAVPTTAPLEHAEAVE